MNGRILLDVGENLEKEIALVEVDQALQFDLEVGAAVTVKVARYDRAVVGGPGAVFPKNLEGTGRSVELIGGANELEGLVASLLAIGINAATARV